MSSDHPDFSNLPDNIWLQILKPLYNKDLLNCLVLNSKIKNAMDKADKNFFEHGIRPIFVKIDETELNNKYCIDWVRWMKQGRHHWVKVKSLHVKKLEENSMKMLTQYSDLFFSNLQEIEIGENSRLSQNFEYFLKIVKSAETLELFDTVFYSLTHDELVEVLKNVNCDCQRKIFELRYSLTTGLSDEIIDTFLEMKTDFDRTIGLWNCEPNPPTLYESQLLRFFQKSVTTKSDGSDKEPIKITISLTSLSQDKWGTLVSFLISKLRNDLKYFENELSLKKEEDGVVRVVKIDFITEEDEDEDDGTGW